MSTRNFADWLSTYVAYAGYSEAPRRMHFWAGVSAVAGALRRKVWIDQAYFSWYPNFYIIFVAPPGIVSKSTTASISMNLLRRVPGIHFGPDVVTWQSLVTSFADSTEGVEYNGSYVPMSAITIESSEFGNLFDPQNREMVDLYVTLWDGKQGKFRKQTKGSGTDEVENPWINMIACTTPAWIAGNFPDYIIGGGFTSRCVFVYADKKDKFVAYPGLAVPECREEIEQALVEDLTAISKLVGEFKLTPDAIEWGQAWYQKHYTTRAPALADERFEGYLARKQTHIHKLAMIISASQGDDLRITAQMLALADTMVTDLEPDMAKVFGKIGKSPTSNTVDRLVAYVHQRGKVTFAEGYRHVHAHFPMLKDFESILAGAIQAKLLGIMQHGSTRYIIPGEARLAEINEAKLAAAIKGAEAAIPSEQLLSPSLPSAPGDQTP